MIRAKRFQNTRKRDVVRRTFDMTYHETPLTVYVVHVFKDGKMVQTDQILRETELAPFLGSYNRDGAVATVVAAQLVNMAGIERFVEVYDLEQRKAKAK